MLTKVEARDQNGALLAFQLDDISSGFEVQEILGLAPVKATLSASNFALLDGGQFQSSRREARNIKLKIGLKPNYTFDSVRDLRSRLYGFFMPEVDVNLRFYDSDGQVVDIWGVVETCEAPLFVKEPQVDISIMCFKPDFVDQETVELSDTTTNDETEFLIDYSGTSPTGINFTLYVDRSIGDFTIYHRPPDGTIRSFQFEALLFDTDQVKISTLVGDKSAVLTRDGVDSYILRAVLPQSDWIQLKPGPNFLRVYVEGLSMPFDLSYTPRYGGL
jgi:hypothetical protein